MILVLLTGLVLLAVGVTLVLRASFGSGGRSAETLSQIESYGFGGSPQSPRTSGRRPLLALAGSLGKAAQRVVGTGEQGIRSQLLGAGMYDVEPTTIIGYRVLATVVVGTLWTWFGLNVGLATPLLLLGTLMFGAIGWVAPVSVISRRARQRVDQIERELPDLIDLLVVTLEAGASFLASLHMAADRLRGPLGDELRLALHEQQLGLTANDALQGILRRVGTPVMRTFVRAVVQGEALGVSTGHIMRNLAIEMRKTRRSQAQERAQKAPVKMLFPLIFLIFPAMFIVLLGPAFFAIKDLFGAT